MEIKIKKVNPNKPVKVIMYGETGVGKSTFAANAPNPIGISPEGGLDLVKRQDGAELEQFENIATWDQLIGAIDFLIKEDHAYKTLVIDTADWVEKLAHAKIIGSSGKDINRVNGGYGSGLRDTERLHMELISKLTQLWNNGMHIVVTAHYQVKEVKDPESIHDYDRYQIKCDERVASIWREWSTALLFAKFEVLTHQKEEQNRARAVGDGERLVCTQNRPAYQAKNRYNMPAVLPFTEDFWSVFIGYVKKGLEPVKVETLEEITTECRALAGKVADEATQKIILETLEKNKDNRTDLIATRDRLKEITK